MNDTATAKKVYRVQTDNCYISRNYRMVDGWLLDTPDRRMVVTSESYLPPRYYYVSEVPPAEWFDTPEAAKAAIMGEIRARCEREIAAVVG